MRWGGGGKGRLNFKSAIEVLLVEVSVKHSFEYMGGLNHSFSRLDRQVSRRAVKSICVVDHVMK